MNLRKSKAELEQRVLDDLRDSLREQFPNEARHGCPSSEEIRRLALRQVPLADAQEWLDHLGRCSACFSDFERQQRSFIRRRKKFSLALGLSAAVAALCIVGVLLLKNARSQSAGAKLVAHDQRTELPVAVLNLSEISNLRSGSGGAKPIPHLPRRPLVLSVHLAPDSATGEYEVEFLREITDTTPLALYHAASQLESGVLSIRIVTDLSRLQAGTYIFAVRHNGGEWTYSQVNIS